MTMTTTVKASNGVSLGKGRILEDISAKQRQDANDAIMAELERLRAENARLKATPARKHTIKVSEKKAVSVYGFGRWPVTLYAPNMLELLEMANEIKAFIDTNRSQLSWSKDD